MFSLSENWKSKFDNNAKEKMTWDSSSKYQCIFNNIFKTNSFNNVHFCQRYTTWHIGMNHQGYYELCSVVATGGAWGGMYPPPEFFWTETVKLTTAKL